MTVVIKRKHFKVWLLLHPNIRTHLFHGHYSLIYISGLEGITLLMRIQRVVAVMDPCAIDNYRDHQTYHVCG